MNNVLISIKRFVRNKNTVTIIGVLIILGILYWGYTSQIDKAVQPVQVPVADVTIQPRTEITSKMVSVIELPAISVPSNVLLYTSSIIGMWSNVNSVIPKGSMFFTDVLIEKDKLPDSAFVEVKEGEIPYAFPVTIDTTYGNSIFPGNKIDIYMKAEDTTGKIMVGRLIENVEVLAVKDSSGKHVFENTEAERTPSNLIFGVKEEINILLRKASYMQNFGVVLFPVPHGGVSPVEGQTQVSTQYLKDFINANTVMIEGQEDNDQQTQEPSNVNPGNGE
ncbi:MAG: hypothetical protein ACM3O4_01860 [Ignavibacteriales bacterium]